MEYFLRFLLGGLIVSLFAIIGDIFRPRNFSGIFAAAPTVALSTLGLTFAMDGPAKVATEGRSMLFGAVAILIYGLLTRFLLVRLKWSSLPAAGAAYVGWFAVAISLWWVVLR